MTARFYFLEAINVEKQISSNLTGYFANVLTQTDRCGKWLVMGVSIHFKVSGVIVSYIHSSFGNKPVNIMAKWMPKLFSSRHKRGFFGIESRQ